MDRDLELIEVGYLEFGLDVDRYFHRGCAVGADYVSIDLQYGIYPYVIPFHDGIVGVRGDSALQFIGHFLAKPLADDACGHLAFAKARYVHLLGKVVAHRFFPFGDFIRLKGNRRHLAGVTCIL